MPKFLDTPSWYESGLQQIVYGMGSFLPPESLTYASMPVVSASGEYGFGTRTIYINGSGTSSKEIFAPEDPSAGYQAILTNGPSISDLTPRWLNAPSATGGMVVKKRSSIKWAAPHCDAGVEIGIPTDSDSAQNTSWALYLRGWSTETNGKFNLIASNAQYVITAQMYSFEGFIYTDESGSMKCKGRYQTSNTSDWNEIVTDLSYAVGVNNTVSFNSISPSNNKVLTFYCRYFLSE